MSPHPILTHNNFLDLPSLLHQHYTLRVLEPQLRCPPGKKMQGRNVITSGFIVVAHHQQQFVTSRLHHERNYNLWFQIMNRLAVITSPDVIGWLNDPSNGSVRDTFKVQRFISLAISLKTNQLRNLILSYL